MSKFDEYWKTKDYVVWDSKEDHDKTWQAATLAERERILSDELGVYNEGIQDERKRCAKIARSYRTPWDKTMHETALSIAYEIEKGE